MVASNYTRASAPDGRRASERAMAGARGSRAITELVERAAELRLRAPELTMVFGERAAALAEADGSDELWVRAESLVVSARVQLGYRASTVGRAVAVLRAAEDAGYSALAAQVRTDLAVCARSVGAPLIGLAALQPVIVTTELPATHRAAALSQLVGCISQFGRKPELDQVLLEADRLCAADESLTSDDRLLVRALLRVAISAHRRRHADLTGAADAARTGIGYLDELEDPGADGGLVRVRLVLQLVSTLLDWGDSELAMELVQPLFAAPERAAVIGPAGWLRFAIATRVLLPSGAGEGATLMLRDAVHGTERHGLHALTARLWLELAHVEERLGRPADAIECLHRSRAAEHVHARARRQACGLLAGEFGAGEHAHVDLDDVLARSRRAAEEATRKRAAEPVAAEEPAEERAAKPVARAAEPERALSLSTPELSVPELQLAPAPAAEPVSRVSLVRESEPRKRAAEPTSRESASREPVARESGWRETASREAASREEPVRREPERRRTEKVVPALSEPVSVEPPEKKHSAPKETPEPVREPEKPKRAAASTSESEASSAMWESGRAPWERRTTERPAASAKTTRHDSEHGSVAAKSVLDRLGISAGGGGGRRRASEGEDTGDRAGKRSAEAKRAAERESSRETESSTFDRLGPPAADDLPAKKPEPAEPAEESGPPAGTQDGLSMTNDWLPRLRLPPSLAPLEDDLDTGSSSDFSSSPEKSNSDDFLGSSEPSWELSSGSSEDFDLGEPFGPDYSKAIQDDEPAADAGLAELLARALAEHRAGTTSASALVKKLGEHQDGTNGKRPVNGHRPGGDGYDRGRHRDQD